jgi:hypothetical protein
MSIADPAAEAEADYDGAELHVGIPEYQAEYAGYQAWAGQTGPEAEPAPYMLTAQAEAALDAAGPEIGAEP